MIGLVGSGNMATALARGWGEPVLCSDVVPARAEALAGLTGGEVVSGNGDLADRASLVVLCHKPAQLHEVAEEIGGRARAVVSVLGGVPLADLREAYGETPVFRLIPSTPAQIGRGVSCYAEQPDCDPDLEAEVIALFERAGSVVRLDESLIDAAMGLMSCAPAYVALLIEAHADAGVRHGVPADLAVRLAAEAFAGAAELVSARGGDTLSVRREVTSPGGLTARGLEALEQAGVRAAFTDAMAAVMAGMNK